LPHRARWRGRRAAAVDMGETEEKEPEARCVQRWSLLLWCKRWDCESRASELSRR
jgi:hypothetical protein